jgi:filamentous hemagglutinin family protein
MKSSRIQSAKHALYLLPLLLIFGTKSAIAQITPATDGTGTIVQTQNNQINISGGTQAGSNQFHSFQQFGVNAGQTANFMANPNIANILGRVMGGDTSLINGMLQVSGSNANLYLINPAGIVFGKDSSLNIPAAFTATTANGIGFGNGNWFNAIGSNNYATLTSNPTSFGFIGTSGSLVNAGNLSVNPGQSIALVGGTVVNTGTIAAPGGNITIAAIPGEKMVRIGQAGTVLSLDLPTSDRALINAPITTPLSLPALLTGGSIPSAMGVVVEDGVIKLTGGSASVNGTLNIDGTGSQSGGNAIVYADNHLSFGGTIAAKGGELGGNGGFVDTSGKGSISIAPNAKVLTTAVKGSIGTWLIDPTDLEVVATGGNGTSTIGADTIVTNLNTTSVNLQADNSITVNAAIDASGNANAGNLTLTAPTANLNQAIVLKTGSTLSGTAATVNVGATGTVQNGVDVAATGGTVKLATATYTLANTVNITKNIIVNGAGSASTKVSGNNAVQVFNVAAGSTVTLEGMSIVNGKTIGPNGNNFSNGGNGEGGGIYNAGTLTVSNSTFSGNFSNGGDGFGEFGVGGVGNGGGIYNAGILIVSNSTFSGNSINGGNNNVRADKGSGGGIYNAGTLTVNNSTLSGNSNEDVFGGGIYNAGILTVSNSTLSGNSAVSGGGINNSNTGILTVNNSTINGNSARTGSGINNDGGKLTVNNSTISNNIAQLYGGGIFNIYGTVTVNNSTISSNSAKFGGGISNLDGLALTVNNSTISGNSAQDGGGIYSTGGSVRIFSGDIYVLSGAMTIGNSIVSGNTASRGSEIYSVLTSGLNITSQGYNLFGHSNNNGLVGITVVATDITAALELNQIIGVLANNGGPTQTHALIFGSPAIGTGDPTVTTPDQRGEGRVGITDIGAFESKFIPTPPIPLPTPIPIEPTPQPAESIPIDRTHNLESPDPRKPFPSISNSKALLCAVRALNSNFQLNDPYQGIETCASKTPEIEEIDRKTQPDR